MPDLCASMRSMAKWVLPVLVGPRTAVTREAAAFGDLVLMSMRRWGFGRDASTAVLILPRSYGGRWREAPERDVSKRRSRHSHLNVSFPAERAARGEGNPGDWALESSPLGSLPLASLGRE